MVKVQLMFRMWSDAKANSVDWKPEADTTVD